MENEYYLILCLTDKKDGVEIIGKKNGSVVSVRTEIKGKPNMATVQTMLEQMLTELKRSHNNKQNYEEKNN